ncbi:glycine cleavage system protein GcvH [Opitutales bacterium]|nr:glycine cleavage system protein GcvH [Opitutales bacterium]MDA9119418.1 glycine cleavage system protein GcvH [Opitutales bacterium]MDC0363656.1 glycine cleavage system protein GcvH [Opitutales bacterium]
MSIPNELKYTSDHEWVKMEGSDFVIGITDHAQDSLGDVTFVELPEIGARFEDKAVFGVVESVKAASDLYMPVTGEVIEVNDSLNDSPENVNSDPYGNGWMIKIRPDQVDSIGSLLDAEAYSKEIGD